MKIIFKFLIIFIITKTDTDTNVNTKFNELKNTNWKNGIVKPGANYEFNFSYANELYISKIKINEHNENCIAMIANEFCLTKFNLNNSQYFTKFRVNYEINNKLKLFYHNNLIQSKHIVNNYSNSIEYTKNQIIDIVEKVYYNLFSHIWRYFNRSRTWKCNKYSTFSMLPKEIMTAITSFFKKLPSIINNNENLVGNLNYNLINCEFNALSKNIKYISTLTENKIYYKNISDLIDSTNCSNKKNCYSTLDIILNEDSTISLDHEINKNMEKMYKITIPKGYILEIELKNIDSSSTNTVLGNIEGSINFSSPNCLVNNVDKKITKIDNKAYLNEDFLNNWNSKNLSVKNCSQFKKDFELKPNLRIGDFKYLLDYAKTIRPADDKISLVKDNDYLSGLKDNREIYDAYVNIRSDNSKIKANFRISKKNSQKIDNKEIKQENDNKLFNNEKIKVNFEKGIVNGEVAYLKEIDIIIPY